MVFSLDRVSLFLTGVVDCHLLVAPPGLPEVLWSSVSWGGRVQMGSYGGGGGMERLSTYLFSSGVVLLPGGLIAVSADIYDCHSRGVPDTQYIASFPTTERSASPEMPT